MTEPLPPLSDEDLSAALDGLAGPDVTSRLQADPSARERSDALRAASQAIAQAPAVPDPGTFDALIARAIQVGTEPTDNTGSSSIAPNFASTSPDGVVSPLAPRRRASAGIQRWLVAAVVVTLVAIGLGLVYAGTHDENTQTIATAATADRTTDDRDGGGSSESTNEAADPSGDMSDASGSDAPSHSDPERSPDPATDAAAQQPADLDELGAFDDVGSARAALRDGFPPQMPTIDGDRPTNASVDRCNNFIQTVLSDLSLGPDPDAVGYATIDGDRYIVYQFPVEGSSNAESKLITAAEPQSCDLLFTFVR